jgi:hypothetical protein
MTGQVFESVTINKSKEAIKARFEARRNGPKLDIYILDPVKYHWTDSISGYDPLNSTRVFKSREKTAVASFFNDLYRLNGVRLKGSGENIIDIGDRPTLLFAGKQQVRAQLQSGHRQDFLDLELIEYDGVYYSFNKKSMEIEGIRSTKDYALSRQFTYMDVR